MKKIKYAVVQLVMGAGLLVLPFSGSVAQVLVSSGGIGNGGFEISPDDAYIVNEVLVADGTCYDSEVDTFYDCLVVLSETEEEEVPE
jgi:hypothetical protein